MKETGPAARMLATILGLGFFAGGSLSLVLTANEVMGDRDAMRTWVATECTIREATIRKVHASRGLDTVDRPTIDYSYQFRGTHYTSDRIDRRSIDEMHSTLDRDYVAFVRGYHGGQKATCWVNPRQPGEAVLAIDIRPASYFVNGWLGSVFLCIGVGIILVPWLRAAEGPAKSANAGGERPVYGVGDLLVERTPMGGYCRFPRRRERAWSHMIFSLIGAFVLGSIGFGIITFSFFANRFQVHPSGGIGDVVASVVIFLFGCPWALLGSLSFVHGLFSTLGHSEVFVSGGRIRGGERAGAFWLGRSLSLSEPIELVVYGSIARPQAPAVNRPIELHGAFVNAYHGDGLAILQARTASSLRVTLAQGYPADILMTWARQVGSLVNETQGRGPIVSSVHLYDPSTAPSSVPSSQTCAARFLLEDGPSHLRLRLPGDRKSIRFLRSLLTVVPVLLIATQVLRLNMSIAALILGVILPFALARGYLRYLHVASQNIIEVEKASGTLSVRRQSRSGEKTRSWSRDQHARLTISETIGGNTRRRARHYILKVITRSGGDYCIESNVIWREEREWCVAVVNAALRSAGTTATKST